MVDDDVITETGTRETGLEETGVEGPCRFWWSQWVGKPSAHAPA